MSSHWSFFPITKEGLEDRFVDVTERQVENFDADKSGIGKKVEFQAKVDGELQYTLLSSFQLDLVQILILPMPLERRQRIF
jgi:hypothetical protein